MGASTRLPHNEPSGRGRSGEGSAASTAWRPRRRTTSSAIPCRRSVKRTASPAKSGDPPAPIAGGPARRRAGEPADRGRDDRPALWFCSRAARQGRQRTGCSSQCVGEARSEGIPRLTADLRAAGSAVHESAPARAIRPDGGAPAEVAVVPGAARAAGDAASPSPHVRTDLPEAASWQPR
jgi:hypothetical protein